MSLLADFHNHSCLSPCASLEQSPRLLAEKASAKGIRLLALSDHNSTMNCPAFAQACALYGIIPLFGMELNTIEELHMLCLFGNLDAAMEFGIHIYGHLQPFPNDPLRFGDQVYVNLDEEIEGEVDNYLGVSTDIGVDDTAMHAERFGAICIPAHVDRAAFSMTSQLGFIVDGPWAALECLQIPPVIDTRSYPLITSSDAHYPEDIGRRACTLDVSAEALQPDGPGTELDMAVLRSALQKRPRW